MRRPARGDLERLSPSFIDRPKQPRSKLDIPNVQSLASPLRQSIPGDVKMLVWQSDHGQCVTCGSNQNLGFDHIIPVTMGARIQLATFSCSAKGAIEPKGARSSEVTLVGPSRLTAGRRDRDGRDRSGGRC
jgi:5-methylcytosine-specific restriction endonuclease McrA